MCEEDADQVSSRVKGWFHNILSLTFESSADKVRAKGTFQYRLAPRARIDRNLREIAWDSGDHHVIRSAAHQTQDQTMFFLDMADNANSDKG